VSENDFDVIVVGAGVIGLSCAFGCSTKGLRVALVDPRPGSGATNAAAGMLAPSAEATDGENGSFFASLEALSLWPTFARDVSERSGEPLHLDEGGSLCVGWDHSDRALQAHLARTATSLGVGVILVERVQRAELFRDITPRITSGHFYANDASIDPDIVVRGLMGALRRDGATFINERATDCVDGGGAVIVQTASRTYRAKRGIIATGYSPDSWSLRPSTAHAIRPVRGSTVRLRLDGPVEPRMIRAVVRGRSVYIVVRSSGDVVLGASSDESSELITEAGTVLRLMSDAIEILPDLEHATFVGVRVGLRPVSADQNPFFELLAGEKWAWVGGHYRQGITMAPLVAKQAGAFVVETAC